MKYVAVSLPKTNQLQQLGDVILVGSGPGGAGFLHRFVRLRPDLSVIWIEKGRDFKALNWPDDIAAVNKEVLEAFPRKAMTWISGYGK